MKTWARNIQEVKDEPKQIILEAAAGKDIHAPVPN